LSKIESFTKNIFIQLPVIGYRSFVHLKNGVKEIAQQNASFIRATSRAAWACGLAWIVFTAEFGYAPPIYNFLRMDIWNYLRMVKLLHVLNILKIITLSSRKKEKYIKILQIIQKGFRKLKIPKLDYCQIFYSNCDVEEN